MCVPVWTAGGAFQYVVRWKSALLWLNLQSVWGFNRWSFFFLRNCIRVTLEAGGWSRCLAVWARNCRCENCCHVAMLFLAAQIGCRCAAGRVGGVVDCLGAPVMISTFWHLWPLYCNFVCAWVLDLNLVCKTPTVMQHCAESQLNLKFLMCQRLCSLCSWRNFIVPKLVSQVHSLHLVVVCYVVSRLGVNFSVHAAPLHLNKGCNQWCKLVTL